MLANSPAIVAHSCVGWSTRRCARASHPGSLRAARLAAGGLAGGRGGGPALGAVPPRGGVGPRGGGVGPRGGGGGPRGGGPPGGGGGVGGGGGLERQQREQPSRLPYRVP